MFVKPSTFHCFFEPSISWVSHEFVEKRDLERKVAHTRSSLAWLPLAFSLQVIGSLPAPAGRPIPRMIARTRRDAWDKIAADLGLLHNTSIRSLDSQGGVQI